MPQTIQILFGIGALVFLLIAIAGGNFRIAGAEIPVVADKRIRIVSGVVGVVFLLLTLTAPSSNPTAMLEKSTQLSGSPGQTTATATTLAARSILQQGSITITAEPRPDQTLIAFDLDTAKLTTSADTAGDVSFSPSPPGVEGEGDFLHVIAAQASENQYDNLTLADLKSIIFDKAETPVQSMTLLAVKTHGGHDAKVWFVNIVPTASGQGSVYSINYVTYQS